MTATVEELSTGVCRVCGEWRIKPWWGDDRCIDCALDERGEREDADRRPWIAVFEQPTRKGLAKTEPQPMPRPPAKPKPWANPEPAVGEQLGEQQQTDVCLVCEAPVPGGAEVPLCERHQRQLKHAIEVQAEFSDAQGDGVAVDNWEARYRANIGFLSAWGSTAGVTRGSAEHAHIRTDYYRRLRAAWKCYGCRADLDVPMSRCRTCRAIFAEQKRVYYYRDIARGQCHKCSRPAEPGSRRCAHHAETHRKGQAARKQRLIALGLCVQCGRRPRQGQTRRCFICKRKRKLYEQRRRERPIAKRPQTEPK